MHFSLKLAVSAAILAGSTFADVNHSARAQQISDNMDTKYQQSSEYGNRETVKLNDNMVMSGSENYQSTNPGNTVAQQQYAYNPMVAYSSDQLETESTNQLPSYAGNGVQQQFMLPYAYAGYNPQFDLQANGYQGYFLPQQQQQEQEQEQQEPEQIENDPIEADENPLDTELSALIPSLRQLGSVLGRSLAFIFGLFGVTIMGGGITTAICTLTPLCTISFALPFIGLRTTVKELSAVASKSSTFDSTDKMTRTVNLLESAMKKFQDKSVDEMETNESNDVTKLESKSVANVEKALNAIADVAVENKDVITARKM